MDIIMGIYATPCWPRPGRSSSGTVRWRFPFALSRAWQAFCKPTPTIIFRTRSTCCGTRHSRIQRAPGLADRWRRGWHAASTADRSELRLNPIRPPEPKDPSPHVWRGDPRLGRAPRSGGASSRRRRRSRATRPPGKPAGPMAPRRSGTPPGRWCRHWRCFV